jgi:transcriptional regulator with XRE-family HTH domain
VRAFRAERNLAQRELAAVLGVDLTAVQRWEAGERPVKAPTARLLLALDRDPTLLWLLLAVAYPE